MSCSHRYTGFGCHFYVAEGSFSLKFIWQKSLKGFLFNICVWGPGSLMQTHIDQQYWSSGNCCFQLEENTVILMHKYVKGWYEVYQPFSNWTWTWFCRKDKGWFLSSPLLKCLHRAKQNLTLSVAGLHWYYRITSLIQSSREELDSKVSDSDLWSVRSGAICVLLCSPSLLYWLHSASAWWPCTAPSRLVHLNERRKVCHLLCTTAAKTPHNTNSKSELSCQQLPFT